jgi:uncharacterized membrane protein
MAGIGIRLNQIFEKNTILTSLYGFGYSAVVTIAPMFIVIGNIMLMGNVLDVSKVGYVDRELFSCTVLYIFIFSLLSVTPLNAVFSRYLSDVIFEERYADILPCYYLGLLLNLLLSCMLAVPFCLREYRVGGVAAYYVFTGFCAYISLVLVFYSMQYLTICKDYGKITRYFFFGMAAAFGLACLFVFVWDMEVPYSMLLGLTIGFFATAVLEYARIISYFQENSNRYRPILRYFKDYWELIFANSFYMLGLYVHNFVFWTTDMRMTVVNCFVSAQPYDVATFLAMFTNISATIIFTVNLEMHFNRRYKAYSEAVVGGRGCDIRIAKERMFEQLENELMNLVRTQFIISVVIFLCCVILLPQYGFSGMTMRIYPELAAGYFVLFVMYGEVLLLYYFDDRIGALFVTGLFFLVTFAGSILSTHLPDLWYGTGVLAGAFVGWTCGYARLRWVAKNLDRHIFCRGVLLKKQKRPRPSGKVYERGV